MAVGDKRAQMVAGAAQLLATRGLEGTSFADVREVAGGSRGSTYHHFPGGKLEMIQAAMGLTSKRARAVMEPARGGTATVVMDCFTNMWRTLLTRSECRAGCAVLAVTVATDSDQLREHAGDIFSDWRTYLTTLFVAGGVVPERAKTLAALGLAAMEGAVALARAENDLGPFDVVADQLHHIATQMETSDKLSPPNGEGQIAEPGSNQV